MGHLTGSVKIYHKVLYYFLVNSAHIVSSSGSLVYSEMPPRALPV